jgi:anti-anti-sigma factor
MKRHLVASAVSVGTHSVSGTVESVANQPRTAFEDTLRQPALSEARLAPVLVSVRTHTLILTGELDRRSAHALEVAIERICEEGVTGITLDLRELGYIDSIGVAVIAFRCGLCKRRGFDFALIAGAPLIHRAFEQAGVAELLPFQEDEDAAPRLHAVAAGHRSRDACEQ